VIRDEVAMPDVNDNRAAANAKDNPIDEAIALIERALVILDSCGHALPAARLDHALVSIREEAVKPE
jgi:hypothetical protein